VRQQEHGACPDRCVPFCSTPANHLTCALYYMCIASVGQRVRLNAREKSSETELFSDMFPLELTLSNYALYDFTILFPVTCNFFTCLAC
jgi:hypothetical protein